MRKKSLHLELSDGEREALFRLVDQDLLTSESDHARRMERFRRYLKSWRNKVEAEDADCDSETAMRRSPKEKVPLIQWQTYAKWAGTLSALFGDDAVIVAAPTGASDQKAEHKVSRYMNWRVFKSMRLVRHFSVHAFQTILYGRAVAYCPYEEDYCKLAGKDELLYRGPRFYPIRPEDVRTPVEEVQTIHEFSWVARRFQATPQELLDGERLGKYEGITDNWKDILRLGQENLQRNAFEEGQEIKQTLDEIQGVESDGTRLSCENLTVWEWYGKRRLPKDLKGDPSESDIDAREMDETEIVVKVIRDLRLVIGVQKLEDLYPRMPHRRPFVDSALIRDGSYWSAGMGELLEWLEVALSRGHNLFTRAVQFGVGPVIFYDPTSGFSPKEFIYEPFRAYAVDDPSKVTQFKPQTDLNGLMQQQSVYLGYAERITGLTDQQLGRSSDRPNAPRTASGQMQLFEAGNLRASLDTRFLREDFSDVLTHLWNLDTSFTDEDVFFRVTEEEAKGLFDVKGGGSMLTMEERANNYDFDVKFATSIWQREAKKAEAVTLFQLGMANPLIAQNPTALWAVTNQLYVAFGNDTFGDIVPKPPELDRPRNPVEEWTQSLQGEEPTCNPLDNDDLHLQDHYRRVEEERVKEHKDQTAINLMSLHIMEHLKQQRQKMMMQALTAQLTQNIAANTDNPEGGGLNARTPQPMSLMGLQQQMSGITDPAGQVEQPQQNGAGPKPPGRPQ